MDEEKLIKEWEDQSTVFDNLRASFTHLQATRSSIRITPQRICDHLPNIASIRPSVGRYIRSFRRRETI